MSDLWLKLVLTALLVLAVTWAGRRFGAGVAGALIGLPITSGPVSLFLALEHGAAFSARAATGAVSGFVGSAAFCAAYAHAARCGSWSRALVAGLAAFALATAGVSILPTTPRISLVVALAVTTLLWALLPRQRVGPDGDGSAARAELSRVGPHEPRSLAHSRWDMPARVIVLSLLVVVLTLAAESLGPSWSGVLSTLPIFTAVLAPFTQAREGPGASILMVGATIRSSVAGIAFFGIVGAILVEHGILVTYTLATASTVMLGLALAAPEARHRGNRMVQHSAVQRAAA